MSSIDFQPWPKIARLNRDITITEKIDGTNAAVVIVPAIIQQGTGWGMIESLTNAGQPVISLRDNNVTAEEIGAVALVESDDWLIRHAVFAQSRTRFITQKNDNYGFAAWVQRNAEALVETLDAGTHFGEWWGNGIQRKYGEPRKHFSLFNTAAWGDFDHPDTNSTDLMDDDVPALGVVPVLYQGPYSQEAIDTALESLRRNGSYASPGWGTDYATGKAAAEGIVIFHHASREMYKITFEGDESPKAIPRDQHGNALEAAA